LQRIKMKRSALDLERFLPYRLSVLSNTISSVLADAYSERHGLSVSEWRVMAILGRFPGSSAAQVAEKGAMDKVAVSRAVSRLLENGRIRRRFADADRRRSILELSDEGWRIYREIAPALLQYEADLLRGLSAGQRRQLDSLLQRLSGRIREVPPPDLG